MSDLDSVGNEFLYTFTVELIESLQVYLLRCCVYLMKANDSSDAQALQYAVCLQFRQDLVQRYRVIVAKTCTAPEIALLNTCMVNGGLVG